MRLNELKFANLSFSAENASRLGSYIYKSGAIVTIKDERIYFVVEILTATVAGCLTFRVKEILTQIVRVRSHSSEITRFRRCSESKGL
jgi:expansin (peptidoglycan-binding protein)